MSKEEKPKLKCEICGFETDSKKGLAGHLRLAHEKPTKPEQELIKFSGLVDEKLKQYALSMNEALKKQELSMNEALSSINKALSSMNEALKKHELSINELRNFIAKAGEAYSKAITRYNENFKKIYEYIEILKPCIEHLKFIPKVYVDAPKETIVCIPKEHLEKTR